MVSFDITSNVNIATDFYEGHPMFYEYLDEELHTCTLNCNEEHFYDGHKDILEKQIATSTFADIFNNDLLFDSNRSSFEEGSDKELLELFFQSSSVEQYFFQKSVSLDSQKTRNKKRSFLVIFMILLQVI